MTNGDGAVGAPGAIARKLGALTTSGISDATGGRGVLSPGLLRFSGTGTVAGRAVTAECSDGSLWAVFPALDQSHRGDFLLLTAPGSSAYLGDLLATDISHRGLVGALVDGLIRDRDAVATLPISVFARGVTPMARRGREPGRPMVPIEVGGVRVSPGDWIVADSDGVVVIPPQEIDAVLLKAQEQAQLEARIMARIKAGAKVMDAINEEIGQPSGGKT